MTSARRSSGPFSSRTAVSVIVAGFFIFLFGVFPGVIQLELTEGMGIVQIGVFLFGITVMTLGAYLYLHATRHQPEPRRLREDVGVRLMATGLVVCYTTGFADLLGIGSHFGAERPLFGAIQGLGVAFGVLIIVAGIFIYSRR